MHNENATADRPKKRRRKPTPEQMAKCGDLEGLFEALAMSRYSLFDVQTAFHYLFQAIRVASRRNRLAFADTIFRQMIDVSTFALCRLHLHLGEQLAERDACERPELRKPFAELFREYLQPLMALQAHLAELLQGHAHTTKSLEHAREKRLKNAILCPSWLRPQQSDHDGNGNEKTSAAFPAASNTDSRGTTFSDLEDYFATLPAGSMTAHAPLKRAQETHGELPK